MRSTRTRTRFASSSDSGLRLRQFRHEREHREVGVAVHEHVLDELLGRKAVDRVVGAAGPLREAGEDALPVLAGGAAPGAGRVDHVGLDVEDELVAGDRLGRRRGLEGALLAYAKLPAGVAERREGFVQREEGGRRAAQRLQEGPPVKPDAPGVRTDPAFGFGVGARHGLGQWHRAKLAIGRRVDLDRQRPAQVIGHGIASVSQTTDIADFRAARDLGLHVDGRSSGPGRA